MNEQKQIDRRKLVRALCYSLEMWYIETKVYWKWHQVSILSRDSWKWIMSTPFDIHISFAIESIFIRWEIRFSIRIADAIFIIFPITCWFNIIFVCVFNTFFLSGEGIFFYPLSKANNLMFAGSILIKTLWSHNSKWNLSHTFFQHHFFALHRFLSTAKDSMGLELK